MTPTSLQALRRLLFFTREEAAQFVAIPPISEQLWRAWEEGTQPIPEELATRVQDLVDWRAAAVAATADSIRAQIKEKGGVTETIFILWYERLDDWKSLPHREPVMWRIQQSVSAELSGMFTTVRLVAFDAIAYAQWLNDREDSEAMRAEWISSH